MTKRITASLGWQTDAACASVPVDVFYPEGNMDKAMADRAKEICAGCPVREQCRAFALATNEKHGIWGGLSHSDRARIRRAAKQSQPTKGAA